MYNLAQQILQRRLQPRKSFSQRHWPAAHGLLSVTQGERNFRVAVLSR